MKKNILFFATVFTVMACSNSNRIQGSKGWISLFDGKSLDGWHANKPGTFSVEDGSIKVASTTALIFMRGR